MSISRQRLYAAGEPFGDACTCMEAGRLICGGGGGSGSAPKNYKNLEKLYGIQADSARLLYDQANQYLPGATSSYVGAASEFTDPAYAERQARLAASDMASANAMERASTERELMSMGVNPNDPRFVGSLRTAETNNAARMAAGQNIARDQAKQKSLAVAQDVVGTFTGQSNSAAQQMSNTTNGMSALYNSKAQQQAQQDANQANMWGNVAGAGLMAMSMFKDGGKVCGRFGHRGMRRYAEGGKVTTETSEELMTRMAKQYGISNPAPAAGNPQPAPPPPQEKPPAEKPGFLDRLRGRTQQIDKASGYADGGQVRALESHMLGGQTGQGGFLNFQTPMAPTTTGAPMPQKNPMMSGISGAMRMRRMGETYKGLKSGQAGANVTDKIGRVVGKFDAEAGNQIQSHAAGMRMGGEQSQAAAEAYKSAAANATDPAAAKAYADAAANIEGGAGIQSAAPVVEQSIGATAAEGAGAAAGEAAGTAAVDAAATTAAGEAAGAAAAGAATGATTSAAAGAAGSAAASTGLGAAMGAIGTALPWVGAAYAVGSLLGAWADGGKIPAQDYRDGARVEGPGSHTDDIVPALLSAKETVMNGEATALIGDEALAQLNAEGLKLRKQGVPLSRIKPHFGIRNLRTHEARP